MKQIPWFLLLFLLGCGIENVEYAPAPHRCLGPCEGTEPSTFPEPSQEEPSCTDSTNCPPEEDNPCIDSTLCTEESDNTPPLTSDPNDTSSSEDVPDPAPVSNMCVHGDVVCDGNDRLQCDTHGEWVDIGYCDPEFPCSNGYCRNEIPVTIRLFHLEPQVVEGSDFYPTLHLLNQTLPGADWNDPESDFRPPNYEFEGWGDQGNPQLFSEENEIRFINEENAIYRVGLHLHRRSTPNHHFAFRFNIRVGDREVSPGIRWLKHRQFWDVVEIEIDRNHPTAPIVIRPINEVHDGYP